ncbi:hypothetical protein RFI_22770, partial [Reticulomyxa filosa]
IGHVEVEVQNIIVTLYCKYGWNDNNGCQWTTISHVTRFNAHRQVNRTNDGTVCYNNTIYKTHISSRSLLLLIYSKKQVMRYGSIFGQQDITKQSERFYPNGILTEVKGLKLKNNLSKARQYHVSKSDISLIAQALNSARFEWCNEKY